jgi:hypothetical protein
MAGTEERFDDSGRRVVMDLYYSRGLYIKGSRMVTR